MKEYKIDKNKIRDYTKRNDNRVFKILIFNLIFMPFLMLAMAWKEDVPKDFVWFVSGFTLFMTLIFGLIYLNNKKLTLLTAENLRIIVDDFSITRIVDLDNEPRMNLLHKIAYRRGKAISGNFYSKIDFDELKSVKLKKSDMRIKSYYSNSFTGENIVLVPRELRGFNEVERIIKEKIK